MTEGKTLLEVCCADVESVRAAARAGAPRIELCSALTSGGVTPSLSLLKAARREFGGTIHVLVRCRDGNFVYSDAEKRLMLDDIAVCSGYADGIVAGALRADMSLDEEFARDVRTATQGMPLTFNRAFDRCADRTAALETLCALGYDRILTSGGADSAQAGASEIGRLRELAGGRITLLAGAGVNARNAREILELTGCSEIHGSCRRQGSESSSVDEIQKVMTAIGCKPTIYP